jgi:predicted enzyme related to lactoylglutathione lyase
MACGCAAPGRCVCSCGDGWSRGCDIKLAVAAIVAAALGLVAAAQEGKVPIDKIKGRIVDRNPQTRLSKVRAGTSEICLLEKKSSSVPAPGIQEKRRYERHWTPVHIDFHVDELRTALAKALGEGAKQEQLFENPGYPSVAFCSDPFGHGFCLIERRKKSSESVA